MNKYIGNAYGNNTVGVGPCAHVGACAANASACGRNGCVGNASLCGANACGINVAGCGANSCGANISVGGIEICFLHK